MTERERAFAAIGFEYAEGIDQANKVIVPYTGREIRKTKRGTWEVQPWNDNDWKEVDDLLGAAKFATLPPPEREEERRQVTIHVKGGVAMLESAPDDVDVEIIDCDNEVNGVDNMLECNNCGDCINAEDARESRLLINCPNGVIYCLRCAHEVLADVHAQEAENDDIPPPPKV